jgi:hypothetical protein
MSIQQASHLKKLDEYEHWIYSQYSFAILHAQNYEKHHLQKVITDSKINYGRVKMEIHIMKKITEFPTLCKLEKGRKLDELTCTVFV